MLSGVSADGIKQIVQYRLSPHCTILFVQSVLFPFTRYKLQFTPFLQLFGKKSTSFVRSLCFKGN
jgi:hypothetical protein